MAQATRREQPAVVLRSHFNHLRAVLAVATVALVGLTAAAAIFITDDELDASRGSENPLCALTPGTPYDGDPGIYGPPPNTPHRGDPGIYGPPPSTPYDGDPGIFGAPPSPRYDGDWGCLPAPPQRERFATEMKDEAGASAAIARGRLLASSVRAAPLPARFSSPSAQAIRVS